MARRTHDSNSGATHDRMAGMLSSIPVLSFRQYSEAWIIESEIAHRSKHTVEAHRRILSKILWFCEQQNYTQIGKPEILAFLRVVGQGGNERWGKQYSGKPIKPRTIQAYYVELRSFFNYLLAEGVIDTSPVDSIPRPTNRQDQIIPFTLEQLQSLLKTAKHTPQALRDEAIIYVMLDTLVRSSELCAAVIGDIDLPSRRLVIQQGKGDKRRDTYFSPITAKMLLRYLAHRGAYTAQSPLFASADGGNLTRFGLYQLFRRLGESAHITGVRCSPHTMRHTAAVEYLRGGGDSSHLKRLLGHTSLAVTQRYIMLSSVDLAEEHRQHSPVERLLGRKR